MAADLIVFAISQIREADFNTQTQHIKKTPKSGSKVTFSQFLPLAHQKLFPIIYTISIHTRFFCIHCWL